MKCERDELVADLEQIKAAQQELEDRVDFIERRLNVLVGDEDAKERLQ